MEETKKDVLVEEELEMKASADYEAGDIQVLKGLEAVRLRPGMYIGTTSSPGLHHLVWEIVDNSIDEALAGFCDKIILQINKGNSITVIDNGRGIPVDIVKDTDVSGVETVFTTLHAGGKFGEGGGYKVSGGLHGVGGSVVNGLSEWLEVNVYKDGKNHYLRFENGGNPIGKLEVIGDVPHDQRGTKVTFSPDPTIFTESTEFSYTNIRERMKQMAYLNRKLRMVVIDDRGEEPVKEEFYYEGGIKEYVAHINKNKDPLFSEVIYSSGSDEYTFPNSDKKSLIHIEVAMQYNNTYNPTIFTFCNNINTHEGGMHEAGFALAINRVVNDYARANNYMKDLEENLSTDDIKEGLSAIVSVKHPNPQYEGQTKTKLGNSEVRRIVSGVLGEGLNRFLLENPRIAKLIIEKVVNAAKARIASRKAREQIRRKGGIDITTLPGKLADCSSRNPEECEIFIVEGNSAGGSAKNGRDRVTQAILSLRGKILNVEKAQPHKVFDNAEIGSMITAIGAGFSEEFDLEKIRYHKIVIMTDADVDGSHIRILLLTFFYRYMRPLIEKGFIYIAQPPLYKVEHRGKTYYAYNDNQLEEIKTSLELKPGHPFQRYKGLGEMDAQQLWETTMDPKSRKMLRVTFSDAIEAETVFTDLMGEVVIPRKEFINENAKFVKNLDV